MKSDKQFISTLSDNIRQRGDMNKLISDRAQVEISKKVKDLLRALFIDDWQSEAYQKHQNKTKNRYQTVKRLTNTVLSRTGVPAYFWLLCMMHVCFVLNHTYNFTVGNVPLNAATGSTCDIIPLMRFNFFEGHSLTDIFRDTNKSTMFFSSVGRKV